MSASRDSPSRPDDARIASALRDEVIRCFQDNDTDNLTVKRVRAAVVNKLRLPDSFFKDQERWVARSKEVITDEVSRHEEDDGGNAASQVLPSTTGRKPESKGSPQKRKSPIPKVAPNKRQKLSKAKESAKPLLTSPFRDVESSSDLSEVENVGTPPRPKQPKSRGLQFRPPRKSPVEDGSSTELSDVNSSGAPPDAKQSQPQSRPRKAEGATEIRDDDDSSDLSEVLDPEPPPKKHRKKRESSAPPDASLETKKSKSKSKVESTLSPQDEEIKRLQSQLVKCGIRKVWGKELKPYDTAKRKIAHLKSMLDEAGMKGRFSEEKARQIKEARELKADIEAIEEGNRNWGKVEDNDEGLRPRRAVVAKGLEELQQFDDEESETDT